MPRRAVRVPKTAELVANQLRRDIVRKTIEPGSALPSEAQLMEDFGVSRPTLREAIRILESEALVSVTRGSRGGARVHPPNIAVASRYAGQLLQMRDTTLEDVHAARLILEPPAARMVAERADPAAVEALNSVIEEELEALDDPHAFAQASTRFHEVLVELSGNQTLAVLVGMLHEIIEMHAESSLEKSLDEGRSKKFKAVRSAQKLVALIEAGEAEKAEAHWHAHVENAGRSILKSVGRKAVVDLYS